jgi:hypothetical protein
MTSRGSVQAGIPARLRLAERSMKPVPRGTAARDQAASTGLLSGCSQPDSPSA